MKCVALCACQARDDDGKIRTFDRDDVFEFKKCPPNFRPIAGESESTESIDFDEAGEDELLSADYAIADLKKYIADKYGKKSFTNDKSKLVEKLIDYRYRDVGDIDLNKLV